MATVREILQQRIERDSYRSSNGRRGLAPLPASEGNAHPRSQTLSGGRAIIGGDRTLSCRQVFRTRDEKPGLQRPKPLDLDVAAAFECEQSRRHCIVRVGRNLDAVSYTHLR